MATTLFAKLYSNLSNAKRAAKVAGHNVNAMEFFYVDGKCTFAPKGSALASEYTGKPCTEVTPKKPLTYRMHFRKPVRPGAVCKGEDFGAHVTALWAHAAEQAANQTVATAAPTKAPKAKGTPTKAPVARQQAVTPPTNIPTHKEFSVYGQSAMTGSVGFVHTWLNENGRGITRKEALYQLAKAGVNVFTARTQYQKWFTANKASL